jgi:hypothetical protein
MRWTVGGDPTGRSPPGHPHTPTVARRQGTDPKTARQVWHPRPSGTHMFVAPARGDSPTSPRFRRSVGASPRGAHVMLVR